MATRKRGAAEATPNLTAAIVEAVLALDTAQTAERSALDSLATAHEGIAHGILTVGMLLSQDGAPSQSSVAKVLRDKGARGWSQPTLSRVVLMYRVCGLLGFVPKDGADPDVGNVLRVRSLVTSEVKVTGEDGKVSKVPASKVLGILTADGKPHEAPFTSVMALTRAVTALAQGKPLPTRSDANQPRGAAVDNGGPAEPEADSHGRDTGVTPGQPSGESLWADNLTAMRGWTGRLQASERMLRPDEITTGEASAMVAALDALVTAANSLQVAILALTDADVPAADDAEAVAVAS